MCDDYVEEESEEEEIENEDIEEEGFSEEEELAYADAEEVQGGDVENHDFRKEYSSDGDPNSEKCDIAESEPSLEDDNGKPSQKEICVYRRLFITGIQTTQCQYASSGEEIYHAKENNYKSTNRS